MLVAWYIKIIFYLFFIFVSFLSIRNIDWPKILKINSQHFDKIICLLLSLAMGYLIGKFFIELSSIFLNI